MTDRSATRLAALALTLLAYLPALTAAPGRMPADSKLYLSLDPGRLLSDATGSFDGRQFAGWVPHQHIGYLWPSGPWFWVFDAAHVADWIAHRLWIGTILVATGLGVRACARALGLGHAPAFAAAVVYQLAPYVLPYVSRTSVMLLPWAGLGWIVLFTIRASRRPGWGDPAAIALIVLTVGAVNATALAMIVPAPALWLVHQAWRRALPWRAAVGVAVRTSALAVAVSLWWIAMLLIQGRHGTDVLAYSESLADVSSTSTSAEVWRGLGYWLFYVRDPFGATTTESLRYLVSTPSIAVSFAVPVLAVVGLTTTRWVHRRFAVLLVVTGLVLGVGVHPIDDRSPLTAVLTGGGDDGLALALRSSTRAVPVMMLGFALAIGALVAAAGDLARSLDRSRRRTRVVAAGTVAALCVVNLPALWTGAFVDPIIDRDANPPDEWVAAAAALDADGVGARVLQVPGAEFGAYRWGYTVDQPLPGLTDKPLVTRDLLPLGSAPAMDLLFALDDRMQDGVLEAASIAPVARLLGVDTIWLTNDHASERFRTARPGVISDTVARADGVGTIESFGPPAVARPEVPDTDGRVLADPRVGEPRAPVELARLTDGGAIVRAASQTLAVSGSGDGLIDIAASGLLPDGAAVRYTASTDDPDDLLSRSVGLVVTDSNRSRARHWRSSQDTHGLTEHTDPELDPLDDVTGDERLPLFDHTDRRTATLAEQRGPVRATASSYGEPFAYLPEHRPVMALDGDPSTAWLVGEHGDPVGQRLVLIADEPLDRIRLRQPDPAGQRQIVEVLVAATDGETTVDQRIALGDASVTGDGQTIELGVGARRIEIEIAAVAGGTPGTAGAVAGVGFREIGHRLDPTSETVVPPHDAVATADPDIPLALVFTRWRVDPMDRWRDDPEPTLTRSFELPSDRSFAMEPTVRVDARASDVELAELLGWPVSASSRLTGSIRSAGVAAFDGDPGSSWITAFDEALGARLSIPANDQPISRLSVRQPVGGFSRITELTLRAAGEERRVAVVPGAAGGALAAVDPPLPAGPLEIEISAIEPATTIDRRHGDPVELPAAITAIDFAGAPTVAPLTETDAELPCTPVAVIDGSPIEASIRIAGSGWIDGDPVEASPCTGELELATGDHDLGAAPADAPLVLDRIVLDDGVRAASVADTSRATVVDRSRYTRTIEVTGCDDGCWLVLGEGFNDAWSASTVAGDLGPPVLVDGGFNGWWLDPPAGRLTVEVEWTAQRGLTLALLASLVAAIACAAIVIATARLGRDRVGVERNDPSPRWTWVGGPRRKPAAGLRSVVLLGALWAVAAGLLIGPGWAVLGAAIGLATTISHRRRSAELTALVCLIVVATGVVVVERRDSPFPNGAWPATFERLHTVGMLAAVALVVAAIVADDTVEDAVEDRSAPPEEPEPD